MTLDPSLSNLISVAMLMVVAGVAGFLGGRLWEQAQR